MSALIAGSAEEVGMSSERLGWARDLVHRHVDRGGSPSAALVVARRGTIVLADAWGVQRHDGGALSVDHAWPIASASKPITAVALMTLVEEGLVGINEPFVDYVPEMAGTGCDDVLVHHLLTHTAGWESAQRTHRLEEMLMSGGLAEPPPGRDLITHILLSMAFDPVKLAEPGEQMDYDNSHYEFIAEIIRRTTDCTLDEVMRSRIFEPLGMTRSSLIVDDAMRPHLVARRPDLPFGLDFPVSFEGEMWETSDSGASGVHMSPMDLAVFGQMILDGGIYDGERIVSPSTVQSMVTNQIPNTPALFGDHEMPEASWGYGFTVLQPRRFSFFSGGLVPFGAAMHPGAGGISFWIDLENEIVGVFFEVITEISEFVEPVSGIGHRVQDVITGAVDE